MPTYPYEIDYYVTEQGDKPFKNWLEGLRDYKVGRGSGFVWTASDWAIWAITAPSGRVCRNCVSISGPAIAFTSVSRENA